MGDTGGARRGMGNRAGAHARSAWVSAALAGLQARACPRSLLYPPSPPASVTPSPLQPLDATSGGNTALAPLRKLSLLT